MCLVHWALMSRDGYVIVFCRSATPHPPGQVTGSVNGVPRNKGTISKKVNTSMAHSPLRQPLSHSLSTGSANFLDVLLFHCCCIEPTSLYNKASYVLNTKFISEGIMGRSCQSVQLHVSPKHQTVSNHRMYNHQ